MSTHKFSISALFVALALLGGHGMAATIASGTLCEVTGDGVNLRSDSRVTAPKLGKAHVGDLVTVQRANMGWYRVSPPESFDCWIHGDYVDPGSGAVRGRRVNVRSGPGVRSAALGQVSEPARVRVRGTQDGWVRLAPPENIGVWIHGKFIQPASAGARAAVAAPASEPGGMASTPAVRVPAAGDAGAAAPVPVASANPVAGGSSNLGVRYTAGALERSEVLDLVRRADALYEAAVAGGRVGADFHTPKGLYQQAQASATSAGTRHHVDLRLTEIALREEMQEQALENQKHLAGRISDLEQENRRLQVEYEARLTELAREVERAAEMARNTAPTTATGAGEPDPSSFTATGWSWPMGKIWGRPGTHRLVIGGRTIYYLNSPNVDLNEDQYWKKYMGIVGSVRSVKGWKHPVIDVEQVYVLEPPRD